METTAMITLIPEPGDFACVPVGGLAGPLISFGEWLNGSAFGHYDHAYIYVGNPAGRPPARYGYKAQAEPGGAQIRPLNSYADQDLGALWSTGKIALTPAQRDAIVAAALRYLGTPYSFLDYAALAAHRLGVPAPGLRSYIASTGHVICSQYDDQCYADAGVHLFTDGRWPGYVTPADLAALVTR
jgi:hypothetical protein